ncbi:flagellar basal body P-ring formation chaperone FlgA [Corallincola spongiicola]|uniref:Flagella basal body P-ring formation protein FlgA n=1 Tax=Corallincola spongiicola TaxID=2520508 RepID=A0ABY1WKN4_9GAMM|nr:flagellar basal body P-ring formation chaperone FlgA [Corallincola spongiicola]TAA40345.1 flagellar basal body P-ring formation protein FlgA [Corallincola spongiicola]
MNRLTKTLIFFIVTSSQFVHANEQWESHQRLQNLAETFIAAQFPDDNIKRDITANKIDARSRYTLCDSDIEAAIPGKQRLSRNVTVQLHCKGSSPWRLYLPVKIKEMRQVVVAKIGLAKGTVLNRQHLKIVYQENMLTRGSVVSEMESVIGAKLKRQVRVNSPILEQQLCVVCKGETVTIVVKSDVFHIRADGIALSDASLGERVRIKNSRSGNTLEAQVSAVGVVTVAI